MLRKSQLFTLASQIIQTRKDLAYRKADRIPQHQRQKWPSRDPVTYKDILLCQGERLGKSERARCLRLLG